MLYLRLKESNVDSVFWKWFKFDINGGTQPQSKTHFTDSLGKTTLCGLTVPSNLEADVDGRDNQSHAECKKCQAKNNSIIQDKTYLNNTNINNEAIPGVETAPTIEEINQWLRDNPQVGTLNNGTFYISTSDMKESPYYQVVKPLQPL